MDGLQLKIFLMVLLFGLYVVFIIQVFSKKRKAYFEDAAQIPFADGEPEQTSSSSTNSPNKPA